VDTHAGWRFSGHLENVADDGVALISDLSRVVIAGLNTSGVGAISLTFPPESSLELVTISECGIPDDLSVFGVSG